MRKRIGWTWMAVFLSLMLVLPFGMQEAEAALPLLVDEADILLDEEEAEISARLEEVSELWENEVIIVTVHSLGDKTATEYADDYFDYNGYGCGEDKDGILFLLDMGERKWAVSTHGCAIDVFTDSIQADITGECLPYISDGKYAEGFLTFVDACDEYLEKDAVGPESMGFFRVILSLGVGFLIALIMALSKKGQHKTAREKKEASDYICKGSMNYSRKNDTFIHARVTSRTISDSSDSSSIHISSSGETHGGSSGSF